MVDPFEFAARLFEPAPPPRWETPGALAVQIDPPTISGGTVQTPALELIDRALVEAYETPNARLIISMPPQEGKSERASRRFPTWVLTQNPDTRIAITSYELNTARRWGRVIRDDIMSNPELGLTIRPDVSAQSEWQLENHRGGVYSAGVGGALTGRPVDLLIIDDPVKGREQADSETLQQRVWDWWTDSAKTRLAPGAPVILILTRWHEDDLAGRLLKEDPDGWEVLSISGQCDNEETDPLGRKLGEFMVSARGRTEKEWAEIKRTSPARTWSALYQQRPVPAEGAVWKIDWIDAIRKVTGQLPHQLARTIVSVDPAAKSKKTSDMTGIVVTALDYAGHAYVLDDRSLRGTPAEWGAAVWNAVLDWNATEVVVEDNQGGDMVREVLNTTWAEVRRKRSPNRLAPKITTVTATQSKRVRAEAVAAYYETGKVHHVTDGSDRLHELETQMITWTGTGSSPDRVDALVHGLTALFTPNHSGGAIRAQSNRRRGGFRR